MNDWQRIRRTRKHLPARCWQHKGFDERDVIMLIIVIAFIITCLTGATKINLTEASRQEAIQSQSRQEVRP